MAATLDAAGDPPPAQPEPWSTTSVGVLFRYPCGCITFEGHHWWSCEIQQPAKPAQP